MDKIKVLEVTAKEWFDRINGNSYFSAHIKINGEFITALPFQYGYGEQYLDSAKEELVKRGIISADKMQLLWSYAYENDIILVKNKHTRCLKREVKSWGKWGN